MRSNKGSIEVAEQVVDIHVNGKDAPPIQQVFTFDLKYTISGKYLPATYWYPEEFPTVDFDPVRTDDVQLLTFNENLDMKYLDATFQEECLMAINKWVEANEESLIDRVFEKEGENNDCE